MRVTYPDLRVTGFWCILIFCVVCTASFTMAEQTGWEKGSAYNNLYDVRSTTALKGTLVRFTPVVPMKGMMRGLALVLKTENGNILVHLGPEHYVSHLRYTLSSGDTIKVKGVSASIQSQRFFIASKVRLGETFEAKLRHTSTGIPYWDLDGSELIRHEFGQ